MDTIWLNLNGLQMYLIVVSEPFEKWLHGLKDKVAVARILARLKKVEFGSLGDVKALGDKLYEMRIFYGPGYRLYYAKRGKVIILLLNGGDKSTQSRDIKKAKEILNDLEDEND